ncbi:MAG: hypothetical protein IPP28_13520 [Xanthomonadales bacterium]|nr:hypothetical protein [Xanthomonadales bacterium]
MTPEIHLLSLHIDSPLVTPSAANFRPPTWPPPPDFPVVIDAQGTVVSRYGEPSWDLTLWAGKALKLSFGHGDSKYNGAPVSAENADLLRQIAGQGLWGVLQSRSTNTLVSRNNDLRQLAAACSSHGVLLSELWRFQQVIDAVAEQLSSSTANNLLGLLSRLFALRDALGFSILDEDGLKRLAENVPEHEGVQTAYIPPRIWTYQVLRLREFLDDYLAHKENVEACFTFCLEAYQINAGGWEALFKEGLEAKHKPFHHRRRVGSRSGHRHFHGPFRDTASRFGIDGLMARWVGGLSLKNFSSLLTMVREVGLAYTLNFSLMRKEEAAALRAGCYSVEQDSLNQDVHLLASATTKTEQDPDARWICSPSVAVAIEAMTHAAQLRLSVVLHDPRRRLSAQDRKHPLLALTPTEPWSGAASPKGDKSATANYSVFIKARSLLFDPEQMRITQTDLDIAQAMTMGLEPEVFAVGKVWPLAFHQLRRTGVCNMLASGLVSEASLRYQLKHLTIVMTRYYGQNYFRLKGNLTDEATGFFLREMYQAIKRGFEELSGDQFISPHGQKRKDQILRPITELDHKDLLKAAKSGAITYRETLLGGCTQVTCVYGGITNIANCMGTAGDSSKPCDRLIIDKGKRSIVAKLIDELDAQLGQVPSSSPLWQSIIANRKAAEEAINVIDQN